MIVALATAMIAAGCSGDGGTPASGPEALQSQCVINQLDLERTIPDRYVCDNWGYSEFVEHCAEGTPGCPCLPGGVCGPDPWGEGDMNCVGGACESSCPSTCIQGSVCCGGSLCSGNCIGTPCCS